VVTLFAEPRMSCVRTVRPVVIVLVAALALAGCSRKRVLVPPTVDLAPHSALGLVAFTSEGSRGTLAPLATQRFMGALLAAQPGNPILELGAMTAPVDAAAARRLGSEHNVRSVIVGHLVVSNVKPRVAVLGGVRASAEATVGLTVRMLSTETGATIWTRSARITEAIANLGLVDGQAVFGAQDADEAYGSLVERLVREVTYDFRSTWVRP
jgi:hypothetical protein